MPNEMTPLEAAEKLEKLLFFWKYTCKKDDGVLNYIKAMKLAISCLRAIAAGEYKRVVHAHIVGRGWDLHCSNCGASADIGNDYCPDCGARMDGKNSGYSEVCSYGERRGESK